MKSKGLIVCGSNSQESKSLTLAKQLSEGLSIPTFYLNSSDEIPLLNNEIIASSEFPPTINWLVEKIQETKSLILVFPQYNYNFSGFFKNVLDWCSLSSRRIFQSKRLVLVGVSQTSAREEEFKKIITWTLESLGATEVTLFNFLPESQVEELISQIQEYV